MSSGRRPNIATPVEPDPTPTPIPGREEEGAKKKVKKKAGRGRQRNILAGKMSGGNNVLDTTLG